MPLLNESLQEQVRNALADLTHPVKLLVFTQGDAGVLECQMCADNRALVEEVAALSDKIYTEVYDFVADAGMVEKYKIARIPAIALVGLDDNGNEIDYGIRFYGIPSGYEFSTLIEDLRMVSARSDEVHPATAAFLAGLDRPVHFQVFVTPT